jgi:CRISPR-associated protein Cas1
MIAEKIMNCRTLLRRNSRGDVSSTVDALKRLADQAREADSSSLLGIEGHCGADVFRGTALHAGGNSEPFGADFSQLGRIRRSPRDPFNALLSFCYSMLTKDLVAVTLGPYLGIYHRPRHGRTASCRSTSAPSTRPRRSAPWACPALARHRPADRVMIRERSGATSTAGALA